MLQVSDVSSDEDYLENMIIEKKDQDAEPSVSKNNAKLKISA